MTMLDFRSLARSRLVTRLRGPVVVADPNVVTSSRLILRPLMDTDRDVFVSLLRDCRHSPAEFFPLHRPGETDDQVFERQAALSKGALATGRAWRRLVTLRDGTIIGAINLNDITDRPSGSAEINFWLSPRHQHRGYGSEAVGAALDHAFRPFPTGLGLRRIWGYVAPENQACIHTLARMGFDRDMAAVPVQLNLAGKWKTHHVYARMTPTAVSFPGVTTLRVVAA